MDTLLQTTSTIDPLAANSIASPIERDSLDLSIVIVNYESWPDTVCLVYALLRSAGLIPDGASLAPRKQPVPISLEIVVVDNGSQTHPLRETLHGLPGVRLLFEAENRGFAAGVNKGWRQAHGRHLLVMNPDLLIPETFLSEVSRRIRWLDRCEGNGSANVGIVGFALLNHDGSKQYSTGYFPKVWWTLAGQFFPRWRRKYRALHVSRPQAADWVSGACFLARRKVFDVLAGMDERFFLYYEEVDFCLRAHQSGWQTVHDPTVRVMHLHPLERRRASAMFREITRKSQLLYFRKNLPPWHYQLLAAAVWCEEFVLAAWQSLGKRVLGSRRKHDHELAGGERSPLRPDFGCNRHTSA